MAIENLSRIIQMRDTKANIAAFTGAFEEAAISYATDTSEFGIYTNGAWVWISAIAATDEKAKVSANDTTAGYLNGKLVAGTNITLTENNDGVNETLTITSAGGGDHVHGLFRWAADGGTTVDLPDIAEYVEAISDDGAIVDPTTWTLSADGSQVTFDSGPTAASVMTAEYVIARV